MSDDDTKTNARNWIAFINRTKGTALHRLHLMSKLTWFDQKNKRALSLGSGAGKETIDLLNYRWDVTCIDKESHSEIVIKSQTKKKFIFQNVSFENTKFIGKYSYIFAYNALPFGDKKHLQSLCDNIYKHLNKGGVFALTLFTGDHTFVKKKQCFGVTRSYINNLLKNYNIIWCEKIQHNDKPGVHWSSYDIIAIKH